MPTVIFILMVLMFVDFILMDLNGQIENKQNKFQKIYDVIFKILVGLCIILAIAGLIWGKK